MWRRLLGLGALIALGSRATAATIAQWDFNSVTPDADPTTGTLTAAVGVGTATLVGGVTASFTAASGSSDPNPTDNSNWRITTWPAQGTQNKQNGIRLDVGTAGYRNIRLRWDQRNSNTASKHARLQYTTNGTEFVDFQVVTMPAETWVHGQSADFADAPGVEDNPRFGIRFVTEFESTALGSGTAGYVASNPGSAYGGVGTLRFDRVVFTGDSTVGSFSVLSYNVLGHGATGWTLSDPQVQAIGRQLSYLQPDVVGFQEIPESYFTQWTNFINAYLPGHSLVIGQRSDGSERLAVASRFPVARSASWLNRAELNAFGYDGEFTRELFEAQIVIPGLTEPLHCFVVHLKAYADEASASRRGAEARAISNFFVTVYQVTNSFRPCLLVGDMNEDVYEPRQYEQQAIQTLTSAPAGFKLTSPRNPVTKDDDTWSARNANPSIRFDYVLPNGTLFSRLAGAQVFRSDKVSPLVPPLLATDSATASDHYPVLLVFGLVPPDLAITRAGSGLQLSWPAAPPGVALESTSSLGPASWEAFGQAPTLVGGTNMVTIPGLDESRFFRLAF